jgi:hypothetical protein
MMDERYIELINREIDGRNTASESKELQEYLSRDSEGRKFYENLEQIARGLARLEEVEPPSYLRTHILNAVNSVSSKPMTRSTWIGQLVEVFQSRPIRRYALVFVSGLCIGFLFFFIAHPWQKDATDLSKMSGTLTLFSDLSPLQPLDSVHVAGDGMDGTFKTYRNEGRVFVEINVESPEEVRIELNSDPDELVFGGVGTLKGIGGDVNVTQGKVIITNAKSCRSIVVYADAGHAQRPLEGRVYKKDVPIQHVSLRTR